MKEDYEKDENNETDEKKIKISVCSVFSLIFLIGGL
jgi:hypothetical protein